MGKKLLLGLVLVSLGAGGLLAQESQKNMVSIGLNFSSGVFEPAIFPGMTFEYGYFLSEAFSLGFSLGTNTLFTPYAEAKGTWYPNSGAFFAGLGLGIWGFMPGMLPAHPAPMISPEIGWRIADGNPSKWIVVAGYKARGIIASREADIPWLLTEVSVRAGYRY
ncbi:MAG: hypothetical protein FWE09_07540 [Treponema sp.]|nr:hypothetical protein [Treponema sp.]